MDGPWRHTPIILAGAFSRFTSTLNSSSILTMSTCCCTSLRFLRSLRYRGRWATLNDTQSIDTRGPLRINMSGFYCTSDVIAGSTQYKYADLSVSRVSNARHLTYACSSLGPLHRHNQVRDQQLIHDSTHMYTAQGSARDEHRAIRQHHEGKSLGKLADHIDTLGKPPG